MKSGRQDPARRPLGRRVLVGRLWVDGPDARSAHRGACATAACSTSPALAPTLSDLFDLPDPAAARARPRRRAALVRWRRRCEAGRLLAPCDLQAIKAAGVTFADSLVERVIEERAKGDPRPRPSAARGADGGRSAAAQRAEARLAGGRARPSRLLIARRACGRSTWRSASAPTPRSSPRPSRCRRWAAAPRSACIRSRSGTTPSPRSCWRARRAARSSARRLGNDVNLRDFEGRSALLLSKAKDNNASCAIGPFVRLFDDSFGLDDVRGAEVALASTGTDSFRARGRELACAKISRDPLDLVAPGHRAEATSIRTA